MREYADLPSPNISQKDSQEPGEPYAGGSDLDISSVSGSDIPNGEIDEPEEQTRLRLYNDYLAPDATINIQEDPEPVIEVIEEHTIREQVASTPDARARRASFQLRISELNGALERTLEEYRVSSDEWRGEIGEARAENQDLRSKIDRLKQLVPVEEEEPDKVERDGRENRGARAQTQPNIKPGDHPNHGVQEDTAANEHEQGSAPETEHPPPATDVDGGALPNASVMSEPDYRTQNVSPGTANHNGHVHRPVIFHNREASSAADLLTNERITLDGPTRDAGYQADSENQLLEERNRDRG